MENIAALFRNGLEIALILFGFGLVVFVHELGHFLAARWAGVRVLAFAIGFGPALVSWRRGSGLRRGSSPAALARGGYEQSPATDPTEYRLNWIPLGGYVKMLGQDDADPSHRSAHPESFNVAPVWKRMVIISAGVVMNLVSAAGLFVLVFSLGLVTPAAVVGEVAPGSPAADTLAENAADLGVSAPGLVPGDRIVSVNGRRPASFDQAMMSVLTADISRPVRVEVEREGVPGVLRFEMTARRGAAGVPEIGFAQAGSTTLVSGLSHDLATAFEARMSEAGLSGVGQGWRLVMVDGHAVGTLAEAARIASAARGTPVVIGFEGPGGERLEREVETSPVPDAVPVDVRGGTVLQQVIGGLAPVMTVGDAAPGSRGYAQGLRTGDVFARLGPVEYPIAAEGIAAVRARAGEMIPVAVIRDGTLIELDLSVRRDGTIGFGVGSTDTLADPSLSTLVGRAPGTDVVRRPGSRVVAVNGEPVSSFREIATALQTLAGDGTRPVEIDLALELPINSPGAARPVETVRIELDAEVAAGVADLRWSLPAVLGAVEPMTTVLRSRGPVDALGLGLSETKRFMLTTYLTLARLFQGSIAPKVLNGPVGIVHAGTSIVDRGAVWLLFFFAMVSVNLAVINFLPVPVTDGGHMVFLLWEQATGRPVSVAVQNAATLAGLVLIAGMFLFVTYNDLVRLLGG
jgi:regulator of sigma E protease